MQCLVVGHTGSGKTELITSLCLETQKKNYVVNNNAFNTEYPKNFERIEWEEVYKLKNCNLIFDDCVGLTNREYDIISNSINRLSRHNNINVYVITHSLMNNNLYGLTRLLPYVILMSNSHPENAKKILRSSCCFDMKDVENYLRIFALEQRPYKFFLFNARKKEFKISSKEEIRDLIPNNKDIVNEMPTGGKSVEISSDYVERAKKILELRPNCKESKLIFQIINDKYMSQINPLDYTITLMEDKSEKKAKFSVLDLCVYLASDKTEREDEHSSNMRLFQFISEDLDLPKILIRNRKILEKKKKSVYLPD